MIPGEAASVAVGAAGVGVVGGVIFVVFLVPHAVKHSKPVNRATGTTDLKLRFTITNPPGRACAFLKFLLPLKGFDGRRMRATELRLVPTTNQQRRIKSRST
jgi:hypothetical protein